MDLLMDLDEGVLTDTEIRDEINTIIMTGHDTTATVTVFAIILIGSYTRVQEKIYEELQEVFGGTDRDVEKQDLSKLVYMEAVLKETMRYYDMMMRYVMAPYAGRYIDEDVKLSKNYALMSMKFLLSHVLRRYRIRADHTKLVVKLDVLLKPDAGHFVSIEDRLKIIS